VSELFFNPEIRLRITGIDSVRSKLQAVVRELRAGDCISFLCNRRDPRPAIRFAAGGFLGIVQNRRTGWLVCENSVEALAARLFEANDTPQRAAVLEANTRAFIGQECRIEDMRKSDALAYSEPSRNARNGNSAQDVASAPQGLGRGA
jgi:hypothetical protein